MKTAKCLQTQKLFKRVNGAKEFSKLLLDQKQNINKIKAEIKLDNMN
jgi:hypothetical protein